MSDSFTDKLRKAINCHSMENGSDTPDFILASFLLDCLKLFDAAVVARSRWYAERPSPSPAPAEGAGDTWEADDGPHSLAQGILSWRAEKRSGWWTASRAVLFTDALCDAYQAAASRAAEAGIERDGAAAELEAAIVDAEKAEAALAREQDAAKEGFEKWARDFAAVEYERAQAVAEVARLAARSDAVEGLVRAARRVAVLDATDRPVGEAMKRLLDELIALAAARPEAENAPPIVCDGADCTLAMDYDGQPHIVVVEGRPRLCGVGHAEAAREEADDEPK